MGSDEPEKETPILDEGDAFLDSLIKASMPKIRRR